MVAIALVSIVVPPPLCDLISGTRITDVEEGKGREGGKERTESFLSFPLFFPERTGTWLC